MRLFQGQIELDTGELLTSLLKSLRPFPPEASLFHLPNSPWCLPASFHSQEHSGVCGARQGRKPTSFDCRPSARHSSVLSMISPSSSVRYTPSSSIHQYENCGTEGKAIGCGHTALNGRAGSWTEIHQVKLANSSILGWHLSGSRNPRRGVWHRAVSVLPAWEP